MKRMEKQKTTINYNKKNIYISKEKKIFFFFFIIKSIANLQVYKSKKKIYPFFKNFNYNKIIEKKKVYIII